MNSCSLNPQLKHHLFQKAFPGDFPGDPAVGTLPSSAEGVGLVPGWGAVEEAWASWSHLAVMQFVIQFEFVVSQRHFTFPSVISIICKAGI